MQLLISTGRVQVPLVQGHAVLLLVVGVQLDVIHSIFSVLLAAVHRGVRVGDLLGQVPCLLWPDETLCALAAFEGGVGL